MARRLRFVVPGVPHHVTQRGNRRTQVFFSDADRQTYLAWLRVECSQHGVAILAYCLMPNHIHLVAVPAERGSLSHVLKELHMRYAQRLNRLRKLSGHTWQGRYFSAALDEQYFWAAMRYVERNPVEAGLVERAEDYPWSSARAHCIGIWDPVLTMDPKWLAQLNSVRDWAAWLGAGASASDTATLRHQTARGLPCGSREFVEQLERQTGRRLQQGRTGRPPRRQESTT